MSCCWAIWLRLKGEKSPSALIRAKCSASIRPKFMQGFVKLRQSRCSFLRSAIEQLLSLIKTRVTSGETSCCACACMPACLSARHPARAAPLISTNRKEPLRDAIRSPKRRGADFASVRSRLPHLPPPLLRLWRPSLFSLLSFFHQPCFFSANESFQT